MPNPRDKPRTQKRSIAFPTDMLEALDKLAVKQGTDTSKLVRQYVQKGLSIEGYTEDIDFIRNQIREELQAVIRPQIERIVKLLVKTGKISAASYYTTLNLITKLISPSYADSFKELCAKSNRLGIDYIKLKDYNIDSYLLDMEAVLKDTAKLEEDLPDPSED